MDVKESCCRRGLSKNAGDLAQERASPPEPSCGWRARAGDDEPIPPPTRHIHHNELYVLLDLAVAVELLFARSLLATSDFGQAQGLLGDFLYGLLQANTHFFYNTYLTTINSQNHSQDVKPNFHRVTHVFSQVRDYGPVYSIWSFTIERLNKVLKSFKTNGHTNGELEVIFMRKFQRSIRPREFISSLSRGDDLPGGAANLLANPDNDSWGMIASLSKEIDKATADGKYFVCASACLYLYCILKLMKLVDSEGGDRTTTTKKIDNKMQAQLFK